MHEKTENPSFDPKQFIKTLPEQCGVYRMLNLQGEVIYVGKARNLKKRVSSYFLRHHDSPKTEAMTAQIAGIEIIITHSENEALILENTLIKRLQPRYNILFKDDKSYPYLLLTNHDYPRLISHRGDRSFGGQYFGPYPTMSTARDSVHLLQKIFKLRNCEDSYFQYRTRPCLQYQIQRCSAPCVKFITQEAYQQDVRRAQLFLQGKNQQILDELIQDMNLAAQDLNFEKAARLRDQIATLRRVQEQQYVHGKGGDVDVIVALCESNAVVVGLMMIRHGQVIGHKSFFPKIPVEITQADIIAEFISQHYLSVEEPRPIPKQILISDYNKPLTEFTEGFDWLSSALSQEAGYKVRILHRVRGEKRQWLQLALTNTEHAMKTMLAEKASLLQRFKDLATCLGLEKTPSRLECFDISHTQGEATVASCVVFDQTGPLKRDYRRFNIENITGGDDYAAMRQALLRRYTRLKHGEGKLPDILVIDGGKGQLSQAKQVLAELEIQGVHILGIAKGVTRKAGMEHLFFDERPDPIEIQADSPALHLLQHIRDEAHRFAITAHRNRRSKNRQVSPLQTIPGIGAKRRRQLLQHFGGIQELKRVSVDEIAKVEGISYVMAERIFNALHS
ncbi:MAG: excinuclease ABC subunit UvrC [Legionellales bacterium]|nr:excinuclease ABC subunit UvrC [Legionellales bacterium]